MSLIPSSSLQKMFCEDNIPKDSFPQFMLNKCLEHGDAVAMIDNWTGKRVITFREVRDQALICASYLRNHGLKKGDFIGIFSPNCIEFPIVLLAAMSCGAAVVPCQLSFTFDGYVRLLSIAKPQKIFVHEEKVGIIKKLRPKLNFLKEVFVIGKSDEFPTFSTMLATADGKRTRSPDDFALADVDIFSDIAFVPSSGGTTGPPKNVMLTHRNLVSSVSIYCHTTPTHEKDDCLYMYREMFHIGGFAHTMISLARGVKIVVDRGFELQQTLEAIQKYKATHMSITPQVMISFVNEADVQKYDISSIKELRCTGAAMSPDTISRLATKFNAKIVPSYGMNESGIISMNRDVENYMTSVGKPCATVRLKIIDPVTKREIPLDQDGEILVKGPQVMKGYLNDPDATAQHIDKEAWLHTGDIGHLNESGMLYIVGRMKQLIKYYSEQVFPDEIESVVLKHPKVADVGVIGIPDAVAGEVPKALVVKKENSLTQEEVISFAATELVDYKRLRGGVQFVTSIPRSEFGKIKRDELKKLAGVEIIYKIN